MFILALAAGGCGKQSQTPEEPSTPVFAIPGGPITVLNLVRDEDSRVIEASILAGDTARRLTIGPSQEAPFPTGFSAEINDAGGRLLFRLQYAWDLEQPDGRMWMKEETDSDELTLGVTRNEERTIEEYDINGDEYTVDYPTMDPDQLEAMLSDYAAGMEVNAGIAGVDELIRKFEAFQEYYGPHAGNTLHGNADGELLVHLINDEGFVNYAIGDVGGTGGLHTVARRPTAAEVICAWAGLCSFKCFAPIPLANPFCVACAGVSLACVIATITCWIIDCGD